MKAHVRSSLLFGVAMAAALCLDALGLDALGLDAASAQTVAEQSADRPASGPGSVEGLWQVLNAPNGTVRDDMLITKAPTAAGGAPIPYQPWAAKLVEQRIKNEAAGHPFASTKTMCLPQGIPDFGAGPFQILENRSQITVLREEFTFFRVIHMSGTHPADPDPTYLGHSIGHWDKGDLVVDTMGMTDKTTFQTIVPHSEALHVVERFHRTGPDTMTIEATIDDPKTFTAPWKESEKVHRIAGSLAEYFCENNRNVADANGNQTVVMPKQP